ncbi:hypothetical protein RhiirB3_454655 [Rhizophagus irregularis]|nr:hypothetical protein RhiirB3_454655 [Rhizophagus irregularis]
MKKKIFKVRQEKREEKERQKGRSEDQTHQSKGLYKQEVIFMGELDILLKDLLSGSYCKKKMTSDGRRKGVIER